jgi:hypothetical protein
MGRKHRLQDHSSFEDEPMTGIYANLKELGVNIEVVKKCSPTPNALKRFHDGILKLLKRSQGKQKYYQCLEVAGAKQQIEFGNWIILNVFLNRLYLRGRVGIEILVRSVVSGGQAACVCSSDFRR